MKLKKESLIEFANSIDFIRTKGLQCSKDESDCAKRIAANIIPYYLENYHAQSFEQIYQMIFYDSLPPMTLGFRLGIPCCKIANIDDDYLSRKVEEYEELESIKEKGLRLREQLNSCQPQYEQQLKELTQYLQTITETLNKLGPKHQIKERITAEYGHLANLFESAVQEKIKSAKKHKLEYENGDITKLLCFILKESIYAFEFDCNPQMEYSRGNKLLIVNYYLPTTDEIPNTEFQNGKWKELPNAVLSKLYDDIIYKISIRSIAEIFHFDDLKKVDLICFNGRVKIRNKATGQLMDNCILSVQVNRKEFESIDLEYIDCKACFKHFKGVSGAKLHDQAPIVPLMQLDTEDKRFVTAHSVETNESTNLATMDWEEFEHLVRELFELEFNVNGGEVKITQASRDGGVDAVAFDPDPIRGGKIVIQAKRYTNTVGVSAVRDLYGTVINEGANKGILITTSDYGTDSYNFAKGKPITLLNGGHLMFLLEKHNKKAHIDLKEAKKHNDEE